MYDTVAQVLVGLVIALAIEARSTGLVRKRHLRWLFIYPVAAILTVLMGVSLWQEADNDPWGRALAVVVALLVFYVMWLLGVAQHLVTHGGLIRKPNARHAEEHPASNASE